MAFDGILIHETFLMWEENKKIKRERRRGGIEENPLAVAVAVRVASIGRTGSKLRKWGAPPFGEKKDPHPFAQSLKK
jgi:hypothetical protein